jgi:hypothetical protein
MAVARRSDSILATGSRANSTITAPSGIANGDILLAVLSVGDGTALPSLAVTGPAGWTEISGSPLAQARADPYTVSLRAYWKIASSESGSYAFTHTSADTVGYIVALTGGHGTTPLSPTPTNNVSDQAANGQTTTYTGLTTPADGSYLLAAETIWDAAGTTAIAGTTPTFTNRVRSGGTYMSDGVLTTAGATGNKTRTNGNVGVGLPWLAYLICVQPAASAATARPAFRPRAMRFWRG